MSEHRTPSVLVVEDETLIRFMLSDYLSDRGFDVRAAASADDAVRMLEDENDGVDAIFSDVHLPGRMDGFALARWVRAHCPETAMLLASGVAKKDEAMRNGIAAEAFLEKPYDLERLADQISDLIATRH